MVDIELILFAGPAVPYYTLHLPGDARQMMVELMCVDGLARVANAVITDNGNLAALWRGTLTR